MRQTLAVRSFRTRGVYADYPAFRREITNEFRSTIAPAVKGLLNRDVAGWKKRPTFRPVLSIAFRAIVLDVLVEGGAAQVWGWLTKGVPEREIVPRRHRQPRMRHRIIGRGTRARRRMLRRPTRAALRFPGRGGEMIFRNRVMAGKIEPRRYGEKAITVYRKTFRRRMENACRRGVRAMQRR